MGQRVCLTGHTGFKGSWLMIWLKLLGAEVFGYSLEPEEPSLYSQAGLNNYIDEVYADIRDAGRLKDELCRFKPEIVMHLAAQPFVRESYREPLLTYATNVMGTANLLEAVRASSTVKSAVVITTDKCYKNMEWEWGYRESDALGGADPYSSSKACAELVCSAWRESFFKTTDTLLATTRAGNVIGGGDWGRERLIPDAIRAFEKNEPLEIRSPLAIRPWQHVLEPLRGYIMLAERLYNRDAEFACGWNFGPSPADAKNVKSVVERIVKLWGDGANYKISEDHSLHESRLLMLDSSRAVQKLGWKQRLNFDKASELTVDWYKRVFAGENPLSATAEQIEGYMNNINEDE